MLLSEFEKNHMITETRMVSYQDYYRFDLGAKPHEVHISARDLPAAWGAFEKHYPNLKHTVEKIWLINRVAGSEKLAWSKDRKESISEDEIVIPGIGTYQDLSTVKSRVLTLISQVLEHVEHNEYQQAHYDLYRSGVLRTYLEAAAQYQDKISRKAKR